MTNFTVDRDTIQKYNEEVRGATIRGVGTVSGISGHAVRRAVERSFTPERIKHILENYTIRYPGNSKQGTVNYMLGDEYVSVGNDSCIIATVVRRDS